MLVGGSKYQEIIEGENKPVKVAPKSDPKRMVKKIFITKP